MCSLGAWPVCACWYVWTLRVCSADTVWVPCTRGPWPAPSQDLASRCASAYMPVRHGSEWVGSEDGFQGFPTLGPRGCASLGVPSPGLSIAPDL